MNSTKFAKATANSLFIGLFERNATSPVSVKICRTVRPDRVLKTVNRIGIPRTMGDRVASSESSDPASASSQMEK